MTQKQNTWIAGIVVAGLACGTGAAAQEHQLQMGVTTTPIQVRSLVAEYFVNRVAELTDGEIEIEYFHSGQLGRPRELLEGLQLGTIDFTIKATGLIGSVNPKFNVVYLPFRWESQEHLGRFIESDMWQEWTDELLDETGLRVVSSFTVYPRHLLTVPGPVNTPDDIRDVVIRVPESAAPLAIWSALGAHPVPVAFMESYQALQQGMVQGVEADPPAMVGISWHEVAKNLTMTAHTWDALSLLISEQTWRRLSESQQEAVRQAASELQEVSAALDEDHTNAALERMREAGVEFNEPDHAAFLEMAGPAVAQFTEELAPGAHELIESLR
jgi:TRAP-type transport system periplasmic protein